MGSRNQVIVLYLQVADGACRHVEAKRLPMISIIERDVHLRLRSGIEQTLTFRVFTNGASSRAVRNAIVDLRPGLTAVVRSEKMRAHVVETEGVHRGIRRLRVEVACI